MGTPAENARWAAEAAAAKKTSATRSYDERPLGERLMQSAVYDNLTMGRKILNSIGQGAPNYLLGKLGVPPEPSLGPVADTGAEMLGGVVSGAGVAGAGKAVLSRLAPGVLKAAEASPRLANIIQGAAEGLEYGGTRAGFEGQDIGEGALTGLEWGGGIPLALQTPGLVAALVSRWFLGPGKEKPVKRLLELAEREGLETVPVMETPWAFGSRKGAEYAGNIGLVKKKAAEYVDRFQRQMRGWAERVPRMLGGSGAPPPSVAGAQMKTMNNLAEGIAKRAGDKYDAVGDVIGDQELSLLGLGNLTHQLERLVENHEGATSVGPLKNIVRILRERVTPPEPPPVIRGGLNLTPKPPLPSNEYGMESTNFVDELGLTADMIPRAKGMTWGELKHLLQSTKLYPKRVAKGLWDDGHYARKDGWVEIKNFLRNEADRLSDPNATNPVRDVLDLADSEWELYRSLYEDEEMGEIGRLLTSDIHPEAIPDALAKDVSSIRRLRTWASTAAGDSKVGDQWVDLVAQMKLKKEIDHAFKPDARAESGSVVGEKFDYSKLFRELNEDGAAREYWDELLKGHPEVRQALDDLVFFGQRTQSGINRLYPSETNLAGADSQREALRSIVGWLIGGPITSRHYFNPTGNPFRGQLAPMLPFTSPVINTLRRGAMPIPAVTGQEEPQPQVLTQGPRP